MAKTMWRSWTGQNPGHTKARTNKKHDQAKNRQQRQARRRNRGG